MSDRRTYAGPDKAGTLQVDRPDIATRLQPGKSGNPLGRPKGSRNKLSEEFIAALYESWQEHGAGAIAKAAKHRPHEYLKIIASLVPRTFGLQNKEPARGAERRGAGSTN